MKTLPLSMAAVLLAAGCAHGTGTGTEVHSARGETAMDHRDAKKGATAENDVEHGEPRAVEDEQSGERVQVPAHGHKKDRIASTGHALPGDKVDPNAPPTSASYGTDPDNTRVNERDREATALTPMDQGESQVDRDMTQSIRKSVIADDSLSFTAKNVKIITRDGFVTLRGVVNNAREKATIEKAAKELAGAKKVTNQLEVSE
jgi:osmotically-inducible protein OsmY